MRQLGIRGFGLGVVVMVALAIGAFVALDQSDETAQAAPEASQSGAVPQGVFDLQFECVAYGITSLLESGTVDDYVCHSDADGDVECVTDVSQTLLSCLGGDSGGDCVITGSEAECSTNDGGSHVCSLGASGVNCEATGGGATDYIDCFNDGTFGPLICGTEAGPLLCLVNFDDFLAFVCAVVSSFPSATWSDVDCDGEISTRDNQALLRRVLGGTPLSQEEPCPNLGDPISYAPERIDELAQAAGGSRPEAVPQGGSDSQFQCMAHGITTLLVTGAGDVDSYTCISDEATVACFSDDPGVLECVSDELDSTCTITPNTGGTEAECTDNEGGSHVCFIGVDGVVNCESTGPGMDYIDCYNDDDSFGPLTCGTESGPVVCLATPDEFLTFRCSVVSGFLFVDWADLDCDGEITTRDNQALLRAVLGGTPLSQEDPCPNLGDPISYLPERFY